MAPPTGAHLVAHALHDIGVRVIFGIVGIPVVEIAEEAINLGIRFIGFRNEQAAGYAASAYGFLTGRPGVCLVVGGPGVLHVMAGIGNSDSNAFPLLVLAGSSESHLVSLGAFQELDAISLLTPHTKLALRPPTLDLISPTIATAYRTAFYGRPGPTFIDLPADLIQGTLESSESEQQEPATVIPAAPKGSAEEAAILRAASLIRSAKAPLVIIGKGSAYARTSVSLLALISATSIPFLPTPMGKGVLPDSHPLNAASARSTALKHADVVLLLGARLNWILHFGDSPKWSPNTKFIHVDSSPSELARNTRSAGLGLVGDLNIIVPQLHRALESWTYNPSSSPSSYSHLLTAAKNKNESAATKKGTQSSQPLSYARTFHIIKEILHSLSSPEKGGIVYVSEGANTMDISRSVFPVEHPRLRLDAGTGATMGVGMGYAIAAWEAYNGAGAEPLPNDTNDPVDEGLPRGRKKVVCLEGDSAFGFSAMEVETMARYGMDVLIFVMNNGGVYHGDADSEAEWGTLQRHSTQSERGGSAARASKSSSKKGLRSTTLGFETRYDLIAEACGGKGWFVRTEAELAKATREGFREGRVCVVNVVVQSGKGSKLSFGWQASGATKDKDAKAKL